MTPKRVGGRDGWPEILAATIEGADLAPVADSCSDAQVFTAHWPDGRAAYLKVAEPTGPGQGAELLLAEVVRFEWFSGRVPVPQVLANGVDEDTGVAFLLTAVSPGAPANREEHKGDAEALLRTLASGLRQIHDLPVGDCPFVADVSSRMSLATTRVELGLVDQRDFDPPYRRYRPDGLVELLRRSLPSGAEDLVVVHGDFSLPNVVLHDGAVSGFVDVGRAGVSDRYVDLAVVARSLARNVSPEALGPFFDLYGIEDPDIRKVDFYVMLDEFS